MLKAWQNYYNALLTKAEFFYALKLAQTLICPEKDFGNLVS